MKNNFYVYIYLDPRKSGQYNYGEYEFSYEPFYVGKGSGRRWKDKKNDHCEYKINKIRGLGFKTIRIKLRENIEETKAFEIEKELIKLIGKEILKEGPLTNETDGGEGKSGYILSEKTKEKLRKDFQEIKNEFENRGYQLLTKKEEYKNNYQKLNCIHLECGKQHSIRWHDFQQGCDCPCYKIDKISKKQRKNFSEIQNEFELRGYQLLTEEKKYKNNKQKLEYIHNRCGKQYSIRWDNFQQGQNCPYCLKCKIDFSDIKKEFELRGYQLLIKKEEYKNSRIKLKYLYKEKYGYISSTTN